MFWNNDSFNSSLFRKIFIWRDYFYCIKCKTAKFTGIWSMKKFGSKSLLIIENNISCFKYKILFAISFLTVKSFFWMARLNQINQNLVILEWMFWKTLTDYPLPSMRLANQSKQTNRNFCVEITGKRESFYTKKIIQVQRICVFCQLFPLRYISFE